jgi:hypothetical protein
MAKRRSRAANDSRLREREHGIPRCDESGRAGFAKARRAILPLPKGFLLPTNNLRCLYLYINGLCIL